ncbi:hypothetical protein Q4506_05370 [Colwellia sp. 4_MG-2023]|uniref:hypothetical protein n=1 Tax=unclassified Colwellia TaxID=196834 RepID=UPI0026E18295|nr:MULTISPECIES: hypothetical protein [unclassified Colwellia]MDO6506612.1 hypothetical protein [Colwellia sp. 5_MG-2023]MDO6555099.1 hypothetical protein [Colwellia sp. 4_MG-2023]
MDAELKKLGIYSLVLVGIAVIATSAIFLVTYYLCDKDQLSNVLGVMGAIGSILSGIAAIIASAAALIAVKSWLKQLKVGKYLTCIWEAKVALSKLEVRFGRWHAKKYDSRDKGDENVDLLYQELEDSFLDL